MREVAEVLVSAAILLKGIASVIRAIKGNGPRSTKHQGRHNHRRRG